MQSPQLTWLTLDRWLPEHFRSTEDHWETVQARVLTLLLLMYALGFIPVCLAATIAALSGIVDTAIPAVITALGSIAASACLIHFRRTANLTITSRLYAGMALAMVLAVILYTGGWQSPVSVYLLTLPVVAGFAMDQKSRLLYALGVWLLYTALFILYHHNYIFVQLIPSAYRLHGQIAIWALALLSVAACLALFDLSENTLSAALAQDKAKLEQHANEDSLTGALNDQALFEYMAEQATFSAPHLTQRVIYIIVNNYRDIAQFYGHETADAFLAAAASRLHNLLDAGAALCRYTVNEFVIYEPGTMDDRTFSRMRRNISALHLKAVNPADGSRFLLDLRIGVFTSAESTLSPQELTDHARATIPENPSHAA